MHVECESDVSILPELQLASNQYTNMHKESRTIPIGRGVVMGIFDPDIATARDFCVAKVAMLAGDGQSI